MGKLRGYFLAGLAVFGLYLNFSSQTGDNISANLVGMESNSAGFSRANPSYNWDFIADFGPHYDYQTEWWYYTGILQTEDARKFGYQLTFFRRGLLPPQDWANRDSVWAANQIYMGHFALSDIGSEEHYNFERFSRGAANLAGAAANPFQVWLNNWSVEEIAPSEYRLYAEQEGIALDLVLKDVKGPILQGINGYSQKGPETGNSSYYFSQTRLHSTGIIQAGGKKNMVKGLSWMDHEFSTRALSEGQVGWDWFSIQLDDGTDLMVFQLRRSDGSVDPFSSGNLITPDGETIRLEQNQFSIQIQSTWRSPHSGAEYPSGWKITLPSMQIVLEVEPYMTDQEMNLSYAYWEGAVGVNGIYKGQKVTGSGYVELTGYASPMEGDF